MYELNPERNRKNVAWSREMSHLSKISISIFLHHFLTTSKRFILMQTPLQLDIWLQSYEGFDNAKNNIKQRNLNTVFANISNPVSPTSDSFLLIMSHMMIQWYLIQSIIGSFIDVSVPSAFTKGSAMGYGGISRGNSHFYKSTVRG